MAASSVVTVIFRVKTLNCNRTRQYRHARLHHTTQAIGIIVKIYTRTGDDGDTSLLGGERVRKNELRIATIGDVDETNAVIGVVRVELSRSGVAPDGVDEVLNRIQHSLFNLGAELAARSIDVGTSSKTSIVTADVVELEAAIDRFEAELEPLTAFILPGGASAAAQLHVARCVCRRAERNLVELTVAELVRNELVQYLNRLSDLLFVMARLVNKSNRVADVKWESGQGEAGREREAKARQRELR
jgi:cob(I)alamin adenosyltransferase